MKAQKLRTFEVSFSPANSIEWETLTIVAIGARNAFTMADRRYRERHNLTPQHAVVSKMREIEPKPVFA